MPPAVAAVAGAVAKVGIMKSLAVAGTAMTAVGAVTKNPKLTKIGTVVAGVGTLGTMGAFGTGAKTLGMSSSAKAAALGKTATVGSTATSYGVGPRQSLTRQALGSTSTLSPGAGVRAVGAGGGQLSQSSGLLSRVMPTGVSSNMITSTAPPSTFMGKVGSTLRTGANLIKDNPEVAQVLASGGVELANYLSGKTDADIDLIKSQIKSTDANAQQTLDAIENEKRRRQNLNQGYLAVNTSLKPTGLIAQNMPGVPA